MTEARPFASLTSGLLARKGAARPAMRRQIALGSEALDHAIHDDLGWNDMGDDDSHGYDSRSLVGLTPMQGLAHAHHDDESGAPARHHRPAEVRPISASRPVPVEMPVPPVVEQREALEKTIVAPAPAVASELPAPAPVMEEAVSVAKVKRPRKSKAAFTLRLDPERHLRLRLVCAVGNSSAQQVVTQALDAFLAAQPGLDALAERAAREDARGN